MWHLSGCSLGTTCSDCLFMALEGFGSSRGRSERVYIAAPFIKMTVCLDASG